MARRIPGTGSSPGKSTSRSGSPKGDFRPTREDILKYIHENPDRSGKREIAKAFSLKGDSRVWLKDMLRDLQDEGLLTRERKRLARAGSLPSVSVLEIYSRDADGGLLARPSEWNERFGEPPVVSLKPSRSGPTPGIGDRVLAKTFPSDEGEGPAYTGRVMKVFEKRAEAVLGVLRQADDGAFRIEPVERRQPEMIVARDDLNGAEKGDLVEVEQTSSARYGLPRARVIQVLGSLTSEKAVSMIAIHAHEIPHIFPSDVLAEAEAAKPATMAGREDFRDLALVTIDPADAKDHDDAVHAEPDPDEKNLGGVIVTVAIADVAAYVRPGSALDREALTARQFGLFPRPRRADAARAHLQRSLLAERGRRPAGTRRADDVFGRGPQDPPLLPPRHDEVGGKARLPPGAGGDRRGAE